MRDPYLLLGVPRDADDEAVHAAYLAAVKACPPEQDPRLFEAVRQAFETIRTLRQRMAYELFEHHLPLTIDLLDHLAPLQPPGRPTPEQFRALLRGGR